MKPKTAIIILIIIVAACGLFMVYLADTMKFEKNYKNTILKQTENGNEYIKENEQVETMEKERLRLLQVLDEEKKNNSYDIDFEAREEVRQELLKELDNQKSENN